MYLAVSHVPIKRKWRVNMCDFLKTQFVAVESNVLTKVLTIGKDVFEKPDELIVIIPGFT
jgi:hypothetical protein